MFNRLMQQLKRATPCEKAQAELAVLSKRHALDHAANERMMVVASFIAENCQGERLTPPNSTTPAAKRQPDNRKRCAQLRASQQQYQQLREKFQRQLEQMQRDQARMSTLVGAGSSSVNILQAQHQIDTITTQLNQIELEQMQLGC